MNNAIKIMSFAEYRNLPGVNFSSLKHIAESPLAYQWYLTQPAEPTPAMLFGTAVHCAILEPEQFDQRYAVRPEGLDLRRAADKQYWAELSAGKIALTQADAEKIAAMREGLYRNPEIRRLLEAPGTFEATIQWTGPGGRLCKGRLDKYLDDGTIFGLKTTTKFDQRQFQSAAWQMFYHAQWAWYYCGIGELGLPRGEEMYEAVVQSSGPFDAAIYAVTEPIIEAGRVEYESWLRTLAQCERTGEWPGRYPDIVEFLPPKWAQDSELGIDYFVNQAGGML
jgi:exodeoxyribonuclease VIII